MLAVVLYISFLELNESIENSTLNMTPVDCELFALLHNKILAVSCISDVFSVFRLVVFL
jgi:hypothetical protein